MPCLSFFGSLENTGQACLPQPGTHEQDSARSWQGTFTILSIPPGVCGAQSSEGRREGELLAKLTPIDFSGGARAPGFFLSRID